MASEVGLYTRAEMREMVRRRLDTLRPPATYDPDTGEEGAGVLRADPLVTNQDINAFLASAVAGRTSDLNLMDETALLDSALIDIKADIVEYPLPEDMISLRALFYLPQGETFSLQPPSRRLDMHYVDEDAGPTVDKWGVPTYRRRMDSILLNEAPTVDIDGGILVDYIKWLNPLAADDQVLETQYARLLQEVIILDAVIEAMVTKLMVDPAPIQMILTKKEEQLGALMALGQRPRMIRLAPTVVFARVRNSRRFR